MKGKTFYVKKKICNLEKKPLKGYEENFPYPCTGPKPSLSGMRMLYWGYKCDIARQGNYIYKLN